MTASMGHSLAGTLPISLVENLIWHSNGTLASLQVLDGGNSADNFTCTHGYDDLVRNASANCVPTPTQWWSSLEPGVYLQSVRQYHEERLGFLDAWV